MTTTANSEISNPLSPSDSRFEVLSFAVLQSAEAHFPIYWIKFDRQTTDEAKLVNCLNEILVDPVIQQGVVLRSADLDQLFESFLQRGFHWVAQKQFLPGVTDNLAHTIHEALLLKGISPDVKVASGSANLLPVLNFKTRDDVSNYAQYRLYHPLVEKLAVVDLNEKSADSVLGFPDVMLIEPSKPELIDLEPLDDVQLLKLSQDRLLALSLEEMQAIKSHFASASVKEERKKLSLSSMPTDVELEILAQTWSEHCKHKIFAATINYTEKKTRSDKQAEPKKIDSLYKTFIKGATHQLKERRPDLLSVFEDNSGVVKWNEDTAICFKVETHNSPSALEPYGGALTGILGVNRDILGTGLGARPIFNTDVFCFAHPDSELADRPKMLPPEAIPSGVRKGVQDGGNKSGIPTVNGAIFFHDGYRAKPLVFCGTGGILPIMRDDVKLYEKHTKPGDRIVMVGGRVGKDGIHGATFSSESMHEGSPVTAVQIGDPFTQKRVIDFVIAARDMELITGITDNGAGGLSSSVGEMAGITGGATMDLAAVPLKYPGLEDWQIVVSESQERMTLSTREPERLKELASAYNVEVSDIGEFHNRGYFEVRRGDTTVALLPLEFLHNGVPKLVLDAEWFPPDTKENRTALSTKTMEKSAEHAYSSNNGFSEHLLSLLSHPNISSREFVIRQYDHEVQGGSVIKPLMGKDQTAPCDAGVIKPVFDAPEGLVISNGLCPQWSQHDPYLMAVSAVDEAVRNTVVVGADPSTICLLDNFCWPDPIASERNFDGNYKLGQLVRTCQGLYDACLAYGAPLISGKDSMKNDFDDKVVRLSIPPTLLVSAIAKTPDSLKCVTMQFKSEGDLILLLSAGTASLTGSHYEALFGERTMPLPSINLEVANRLYKAVFDSIQDRLIQSAHDLSEGGLAVALAECSIGSGLGADIDLDMYLKHQGSTVEQGLFGEGPAKLLITIKQIDLAKFNARLNMPGISCITLGQVTTDARLLVSAPGSVPEGDGPWLDLTIEKMRKAWSSPLPFD
ncbi:MAG: hypothetical protein K2X93_07180 [Candidatus Obscuribacterales bacterium]|nr:hypothetical protein [Candidatus Obscuribacterales bacterium]